MEQNSGWLFGRERFTAVPRGDRWLLARDPDTGRAFVRHEPIFAPVDRSRTLRSEPFSSRLATDQRSKNSCA